MYPGLPSRKALRTSPFARCDEGVSTLRNGITPLRDANHSDVQLYKAANTMTGVFYHVVTAHQSGPEMMAGLRKAYMAVLNKMTMAARALCSDVETLWKARV